MQASYDVRHALSDVPADNRGIVRRKLMVLGYKMFCNEFGPNLSLLNVQKLLDTPIEKLAVSGANRVIPAKPARRQTAAPQENKDGEDENMDQANQHPSPAKTKSAYGVSEVRKSRPDAMKSYPFADNAGTAADIMKGPDGSSFSFIMIGTAARKRMAKKVFDEHAIGRAGMHMQDIPMGLKALGLPITYAGEELFREAAGKKVKQGQPATVSASQWTTIVERYVSTELEKVRRSAQAATAAAKASVQLQLRQQRDEVLMAAASATVDAMDGDSDVQAWEEEGEDQRRGGGGNIESDDALDTSGEASSPSPPRRNPRNNKTRATTTKGRIGAPRPTKTSDLRKVQSRIAAEVESDRQHFRRVKLARAKALLERVGNLRINEGLPDEFEDEENDMPGGGSGDERDDRDRGPIYEGKRYGAPVNVGRWSNPASGSVALEIADAFFKGSVGRELMRGPGSGADASHPFADVLGLKEESDDGHDQGLGLGHQTAQEKADIAQNIADAKQIYAEGWERRKGGWAADFGPPHTRSLDTAPGGFDMDRSDEDEDPSSSSGKESSGSGFMRSLGGWVGGRGVGGHSSGSGTDSTTYRNSVSLADAAAAARASKPKKRP
jgi:hypothetical protein